jgi:hypothetical protein
MVIEYAQLLSTALHVSGSTLNMYVYKQTHINHPCSIWVRESLHHWSWLWKLGSLLGSEYTRRYGTINKATRHLRNLPVPNKIPALGWLRDPPQAMPEEYQCDDVVQAYRNFYIGDKSRFATWQKLGKIPYWYNKLTD